MALLVPLSFGFTYLMIKLAKNAEANAKKQKPAEKNPIQLPSKWLYILFVVLIGFQVYLNIAAYYAVLNGMKNYSLFLIGILMLVFAGMFHLYRYGRGLSKSDVEVITTRKRKFIFPSFGSGGAKLPLASSIKERELSDSPSTTFSASSERPLEEKKPVEVAEIKTSKGNPSTSISGALNAGFNNTTSDILSRDKNENLKTRLTSITNDKTRQVDLTSGHKPSSNKSSNDTLTSDLKDPPSADSVNRN